MRSPWTSFTRATDGQRYDIVTIAAVRDDVEMLKLALELGGNATVIIEPDADRW